jgi:hypothetical protein
LLSFGNSEIFKSDPISLLCITTQRQRNMQVIELSTHPLDNKDNTNGDGNICTSINTNFHFGGNVICTSIIFVSSMKTRKKDALESSDDPSVSFLPMFIIVTDMFVHEFVKIIYVFHRNKTHFEIC